MSQGRLLRLPMTVLDDQRIGDGIYRTMYDAPAIQGICFDITLQDSGVKPARKRTMSRFDPFMSRPTAPSRAVVG